jgi:hypothetical protein
MKRNLVAFLVIVSIAIVSCNTVDDKVPTIAADYCNCFNPLENAMDSSLKEIYRTSADANDPAAELNRILGAMDSVTRKATIDKITSLATDLNNPRTEAGKCIVGLKEKYKNAKTRNRTKFNSNLLAELKNKGCTVAYSFVKVMLKSE